MIKNGTKNLFDPRRRTNRNDGINPWLEQEEAAAPLAPELLAAPVHDARLAGPQQGVTYAASAALPVRQHFAAPPLWLVGTHGGAGESSLAALGAGWEAGGHAWPVESYATRRPPVLLVCRSSAAGLLAAQRAATQWAAGQTPTINLLGLVIVADAPGRLPKPLRELAHVIGGGVPRRWDLPWLEQWRLGAPISPSEVPAAAQPLVAELHSHLNTGADGATS